MKLLKSGLSLALMGASLALVPSASSAAVDAAPQATPRAGDDTSMVQRMRNDASGTLRSSTERATGKLSFVRATGSGAADLLPAMTGTSTRAAVAKADSYLDTYATAFGADPAQLSKGVATPNSYGTTITYTQSYDGVPVYGSLLRAHVDQAGDLTAVNGELVPVGDVDTTAALTPAEAGARAVKLVKAQPPVSETGTTHVGDVSATASDLVIYKRGLVQGVGGGATELVYQVEVGNGSTVRDMVFLDADSGKVVNRYSMVEGALDRELYEADEDRNLELVFEEGDPFPGDLNQDQQNLVLSTGEIYWLFRNTFGRDSYDGNGATMKTVNNDPAIACPNANWNGTTANYCDGVTSDEVVAHEWTHAYTEYTHGLIYQYQSGALNEGYSDVFGETVDLVNNREDEGEGDIVSPREVGLCSAYSPARPQVTINAPSDIARDCLTGGAAYGAQLDAEGITEDVVAPTDAVEEGGTALDGCSAYDDDVTGKIVLVNRGLCPFTQKSQVAEAAGAAALIIGNGDDSVISPSGDIDISIPTVTIGLTDREAIRDSLAEGDTVNVTMKDASGDQKSDSYRWLIGEKSPAFGGAIRDMWNPTCYGDPGKVSDVEYKCSTDDNGGVHGNSGVVNHGYSLLVDGGTFNDVAIRGIGLDKALNIYYRAMTEYQTPASNFVDHADALAASCTDLTNKAINEITTEANNPVRSKQKITADDCAQVAAMSDAVELRLDPTEQCNFQPIFDQGAPAPVACAADGSAVNLLSEDFESGLGDWTLSSESVYGGPTREWTVARPNQYEGDHSSTVAYGPAPDLGECDGGSGDFSSVDYMTGPSLTVPSNATEPRMTFEQSIATEVGFDGGTVQLSVNGGDFATVPAAAYTFNAPGNFSTAEEGNTNPLAGEPGFTGVDPNKLYSEWGTSQIDLSDLVEAGDDVQVRFAVGRDGCGGIEGWFVDNIALAVCLDGTSVVTARHEPDPSTFGEQSTVEAIVSGGADTVTVSEDGTELGSAPVTDNTASVTLPADLAVGEHTLTVTSGQATTEITATVSPAPKSETTFTTFQRTPEPSTYGQASVLEMLLSSDSATGEVTVSNGSKEIGSASVDGGYASVDLPKTLPAGDYELDVAYSGDDENAAASDTVDVTVEKAATTGKVVRAPQQVTRGTRAGVRVRVVSPDVRVNQGRVRLYRANQVWGTAPVNASGLAKIKTKRLAKVGRYRFRAEYLGGRNYETSTVVVVVRVVPKR